MGMVYVRPRDGGRVRQPERRYRVMPADGAFVPADNAYYTRLLISGDVVKSDPPPKPAAAAAQSASPPPGAAPATTEAPAAAKRAPHVETPTRPA